MKLKNCFIASAKKRIGIKDRIFAGMGEKFQIWEPKNYQDEVDALDLSFKNLPEDENPFKIRSDTRLVVFGGWKDITRTCTSFIEGIYNFVGSNCRLLD